MSRTHDMKKSHTLALCHAATAVPHHTTADRPPSLEDRAALSFPHPRKPVLHTLTRRAAASAAGAHRPHPRDEFCTPSFKCHAAVPQTLSVIGGVPPTHPSLAARQKESISRKLRQMSSGRVALSKTGRCAEAVRSRRVRPTRRSFGTAGPERKQGVLDCL